LGRAEQGVSLEEVLRQIVATASTTGSPDGKSVVPVNAYTHTAPTASPTEFKQKDRQPCLLRAPSHARRVAALAKRRGQAMMAAM